VICGHEYQEEEAPKAESEPEPPLQKDPNSKPNDQSQ
jgi:hypothetical protein